MSEAEKAQEAKFVPAFFLDVVEQGQEIQSGKWPHHITLFPPLKTTYDPVFGEALRGRLNQHYPFIVRTSEETVHFGPNEDKPARLLEPSLSLQGVQYLIEKAVGDILHDRTYRDSFRPHITVEHFDDVRPGRSIFIEGLCIVEKRLGGVWTVVDKLRLKGGEYEAR